MTFPRLPNFYNLHESLGKEFMDNAETLDALNRLSGKRGSTVMCPLCGHKHAENYTLRHVTSEYCISYRTQIWAENNGLWNIHFNYSKMLEEAEIPTVMLPSGRIEAFGSKKYKNTSLQIRTHTWAWAVILLKEARFKLTRQQRVAGLKILNQINYFGINYPYCEDRYRHDGPKGHRRDIRLQIREWLSDDILKVLRGML